MQLELIKGIFASEEARDILLTMINDKIRFHDLQIFKKTERNEVDDLQRHYDRIAELKAQRNELQLWLETMSALDYELEIHGVVNIKPVTNQVIRTESEERCSKEGNC
jgi:hypothetical protein